MVLLGLTLITVGVLIVVAAVFTASIELNHVEVLGLETTPLVLFLLGVAAGVAVLWGLGVLKYGTKRTLRQRRESKRLEELSAKLDRVDRDRADERAARADDGDAG